MMGLGISWTILTILNGFCAWRTGAVSTAYETCGDDLIALFTPEQKQIFEESVESISLVLNKSKSYYHPLRGVFCERLVKRDSTFTASCEAGLRPAEATGNKAICKKHGVAVHDVLHLQSRNKKNHKELRAAAARAVKRTAISGAVPGPLVFGGGDASKPSDVRTVRSYLQHGAVKATYNKRPGTDTGSVMVGIKALPPVELDQSKQSIKVSDLMIYVDSQLDLNLISQVPTYVREIKNKPRKILIEDIQSRSTFSGKAQALQLNDLAPDTKLSFCKEIDLMIRYNLPHITSSQRKRIEGHIFNKRYGLALFAIQKYRDTRVDYDAAMELIHSSLHPYPHRSVWGGPLPVVGVSKIIVKT